MRRLRGAWPVAVVAAAPLLLFAPFLTFQRVLYWGTVEFQFYPWRQLAVEALSAGHLPLWNPLLGNGAPLLANYQSAVLYPPNWLAQLLPLDLAQSWLAALHLAWAGVGMVALARALRLPPLGQVVAGLAFGLSQYLVSRVGFFSINATVAWLPWMVCLAEWQLLLGERAAVQSRRALPALLLAVCVGLQLLAGHAQTAWYTWLLTAAWSAWRLFSRSRQPALARLRTAAWLAMPVSVGFLLACVQLVPTAELLSQSPRATSASYDFVMTYSFSPWRLLTLLAPDLLGNPARGQFFGYGNYWEDAIYIGVLPLLLAVGAAARSLVVLARRHEETSLDVPAGLPYFLLALLAVSLVLGLGQNTPVFPLLYWRVPTFNLFQAPTRLMICWEFALALLAGIGAANWRQPRGGALYWTRLGTAGAAAMAAVGLGAGLLVSPATPVGLHLQAMGRAVAVAGMLLFLAGLLSLIRPKADSRWWLGLVVLVVAADLLYADYGLNPGAPADLYRRPAASAQAIGAVLQTHRLLYFPNDEYDLRYGRFVSFQSFGASDLAYGARESLLPDVAMLDEVAAANNFDPLVSARYAGLMNVISATHSLPLLRLMDVSVVASSAQLDLERIASSEPGGVNFYRVPGAPQRVWVVTRSNTAPSPAAALASLADPAFDPSRTVILEAGDGQSSASPVSLTPAPAARTIPVNLTQAGWVVLSDTNYPGWVATIDGRATPVLRADYAFRAVAVPAGAHTVVFDYQPNSLRVGWLLSGLGTVLVIALAVWALGVPRRAASGTRLILGDDHVSH